MSADSLNASPLKKLKDQTLSPIDDRTYNKNEKEDERLSNCERLSQVSPFLLSPTTDTSAPDNSDNVAGCSTLSKPTIPTDAKSSKPSETQCLSKATSIDSWCSNDTLYNVEENFDDLALEPDVLMDFEPDREPVRDDKSESTDTLTHNEEKELSHCSTYIIHDSKSEVCETFSPDSITGNDYNTYTKPKTEVAGATPSVMTKSELNDSTKNTQTKDLAYGTLMSGLPSYSNCTTDLLSTGDEAWKMQQPELVRRSPLGDDFNFTPPKPPADKECTETTSPKTVEPTVTRMDSVEVTCLKDNSDSENKSETESQGLLVEINDSQDYHYRNMAHSVTSTPLTELQGVNEENVEAIPMQLPRITTDSAEYLSSNLPNFQTFLQSAEIRPQDLSSGPSDEGANSHQDSEILLEGDSKSLSRNSNKDSLALCDRTPTYSDFENSASARPQEVNSKEKSESLEAVNSQDFRNFETSARNRPQDLSSLIDASSLLLKSERRSSSLAMESTSDPDQTHRSGNIPNHDTQPLVISPPKTAYESHVTDINRPIDVFITDLDTEEETEQPHSIIITESPLFMNKVSPSANRTFESHADNITYDSHAGVYQIFNREQNRTSEEEAGDVSDSSKLNGFVIDDTKAGERQQSPKSDVDDVETAANDTKTNSSPNNQQMVETQKEKIVKELKEIKCNGDSQKYATVSFLNESFEELLESNVDDNDSRDFDADLITKEEKSGNSIVERDGSVEMEKVSEPSEEQETDNIYENLRRADAVPNGVSEADEERLTSVTEDFLQNEKKFCELDSYFPLLSDIRFTGPGTEIMSTSFNQDTPTEAISPECEQDSKPDTATDILKEWDSDSDSHSTNSSSGEFIWKDGDGRVSPVVPSTRFEHQREGGGNQGHQEGRELSGSVGNASSGSEGSEGSEGDEVEFVPSSWDCRAAPSKSSLRSLEQAPPDSKKRVVFKRQKYHCVYEYPREVAEENAESPAYLPDYSTYSEWDPTSTEDAELGYGQLFGGPSPLDMFPLRSGITFSTDYDEDFFISSSARPFESLGVMSTTSQFFPGMHVKPSLLERDIDDLDDFPPPPSPLPPTTLAQTRTPSLDFTTPDSGVEDITPGSTSTDEDFKAKKPDSDPCWRPVDSASSSESVSPSSPGGEALGGLRHTRDKLKLDLPPSPHLPSPRHNRVFNFVLDKPKRRSQEERTELGTTPLVMTDETPVISSALPVQREADDVIPEPTFSTFGKCSSKSSEPEQKAMILTDDVQEEGVTEASSGQKVEAVKGEGTVLDSGDEDSGIESSSKATLERNKTTPNTS